MPPLDLETREENLASPDKETIRKFFDSIAFRYDQINHLLSFFLDERWRRKAVRLILENPSQEKTILDLGVGTGKFLKGFAKKRSWQRAVGVDFAWEMLERARTHLPAGCDLVRADIHDLPFENESFDLVVSSFTLRSVKDRPHFFGEVRRILKEGGKAGFLCLTRPTSFLTRALYAPYLKIYLPFVGKLLSKEPQAYHFLSQSIQTFPSPQENAGVLRSLGFRKVSIHAFTFGVATLLIAQK